MIEKGVDCVSLPGHGRSSTVLCRVVELRSLPGWKVGPVPFCQASTAEARDRGVHRSTDAEARMTLVDPDLAAVLYSGGHRRWRPVLRDISGHHVLAVELCRVDGTDLALLAVHLSGADALPLGQRPQSAGASEFWAALGESLLGGVSFAPGPVRTVTFCAGSAQSALEEAYAAVTGLGDEARRRASRHRLSIEKPDWSALVLRDGLAIISHPTDDHAFGPHLRVQTHSIFIDALLLAWTQRILIDRSASRAQQARLDTPHELVELERRHYDFKRTAWRRSLTHKRTAPVDVLLLGLQRELLTDRDVEDVEERVQDGARLARTLHQEKIARAQESLNRLVQVAAVVIGALGLAYAAAPTLAVPSLELFLSATAVGIGAMVIALVLLSWMAGDRRRREQLSRPVDEEF